MKELYFKTGRKGIHIDFTRSIPVHTIHKSISVDQRNIMLQAYCITGCDTCCAFYGTGQKTAFNVMIKGRKRFQSMSVPDVDMEEGTGIYARPARLFRVWL